MHVYDSYKEIPPDGPEHTPGTAVVAAEPASREQAEAILERALSDYLVGEKRELAKAERRVDEDDEAVLDATALLAKAGQR